MIRWDKVANHYSFNFFVTTLAFFIPSLPPFPSPPYPSVSFSVSLSSCLFVCWFHFFVISLLYTYTFQLTDSLSHYYFKSNKLQFHSHFHFHLLCSFAKSYVRYKQYYSINLLLDNFLSLSSLLPSSHPLSSFISSFLPSYVHSSLPPHIFLAFLIFFFCLYFSYFLFHTSSTFHTLH